MRGGGAGCKAGRTKESSQETEPWWMATANAVLDAYHVQGTVCVRPHSILATGNTSETDEG